MVAHSVVSLFFFFNDTATTEIYTLSLHDALPISRAVPFCIVVFRRTIAHRLAPISRRSEEHTSELQSLAYLVCRLLLEKKKQASWRATSRRARRSCSSRAGASPSTPTSPAAYRLT